MLEESSRKGDEMSVTLYNYLWINRHKFTKVEFAKKVGISPQYLSRIVSGSMIPSISLSKRIERETKGIIKWYEIMEYSYQTLNNPDSLSEEMEAIDRNVKNN